MVDDSQLFGILMDQVGDGHENLIELLLSQEDFISEEKLANQTGLKVNEIRKVLYKLYELRYCEYKKTKKPNGWFVYFWKLNPDRIIEEFNAMNLERFKELQSKLEYEKEHKFFKCDNKCHRLTYKEALDANFVCPECGGILKHHKNLERIEELGEEITRLKKEFNF